MLRTLALLAVTAFAVIFSDASLATIPVANKWMATNGTGSESSCRRDANGNCKLYESPEEACKDVSNFPSGWEHDLGTGTINPPNSIINCIAYYSVQGCHPPHVCPTCSKCNTGISASERSTLAFCPVNSTQSGSNCNCNAGFTETGKKCDGGENNGQQCPNCVGNPVNAANGNKLQQQPIYRGLNGFELTLTFNTFDEAAPRFAKHWRDNFDRKVVTQGSNRIVYRPDGKALQFTPPSSGNEWVREPDTADRLIQLSPSGWQFIAAKDDEVETFDANGRLTSIQSRSGLTQTLTYSTGTGGTNGFVLDSTGTATSAKLPAGLLIEVADAFGRKLVLGYNIAYRVIKVTDPASGVYRFTYVDQEQMTEITFPDTKVRKFVYNESANTSSANLPDALTGIVDENNDRFATFKYDSQKRAISSEHAGTTNKYTFSYSSGSTSVTDPRTNSRTYSFQTTQGAFKNTGIAGAVCPECGPASQGFDTNGNVTSRVDWNGNRTNYTYDTTRVLETSRTEALTSAGATTTQTRTITTEWHSTFRLPLRIAEPLRITTYTYDANGSTCGAIGAMCSKSVQATTDANGSQGFSATTAGSARAWSYTYNGNGSILTVNGPRTDVTDTTTYTYYSNTDTDLGKRGNVATITNAASQVTSITSYNAHGQPLTIVDPNSVTTTLAYDSRQRLTSRTVGSEVTSYEYYATGLLKKVTLPDSSYLLYTYDTAHRLTAVEDNLGNKISYTLDAMGNSTAEEVRDPSNVLVQTRTREYNSLNRLFKDIGAANQVTEYAYDDQGNVTTMTQQTVFSPAAYVTTSNQYDALNRLKQVTDPGTGVTQYAYNGLDALTQVTDPRSLSTAYTVDGLGNLTLQSSPDTGSTSSTYDTAGNLLTQTDAKSQVTTYTYDALNRVTLITFHDSSKQTYAYDSGTNGVGRLSSITETNPSDVQTGKIEFAYDAHGRVTSETRTLAGVSYVVGYSYDSYGRMSGMTYPSGRTLTYGFDSLGRVNQLTTTKDSQSTVLVQNVSYHPFGGVKGFTLGNGQVYSRSIDQDGRIASYTLGSTSYSLTFDAASRITGIGGNTYGYDNLDRLTSAVLSSSNFGYSYDAVGNRLTKVVGSNTDNYTYGTTSNRIATLTPAGASAKSFTLDSNGSTTNDGVNTYSYDTRGRMTQSVSTAGTTNYQVNALGQRVKKSTSTTDTVFHYDTRGRLVAETDATGAVKRELFYLGDIPVAVFQ